MFALCHQLGYQPDERGFDETFSQVVRHPEAAVFVAVLGAKTLGYLALSYRPQIRLGGRTASIDELVVAADQRGAGIGSSLLQSVTSMQEATLTFAPKLLALSGAFILLSPWLLRSLSEFTISFITRMGTMGH